MHVREHHGHGARVAAVHQGLVERLVRRASPELEGWRMGWFVDRVVPFEKAAVELRVSVDGCQVGPEAQVGQVPA